jgi:hypothetical protein
MANDLPFLAPEAAVRVLVEEHGVTRSTGTLRKLRCTGGGPQFAKLGRQILYRRDWLAEWVRDRVSQPMSSTSDGPPLTVARPALSRKTPAHHGRTKRATK